MANAVTQEFLWECRQNWQKDVQGRQTANAMVKNGPLLTAMDLEIPRRLPFSFSVDVWNEGVTDQGESLRCWAFASLNIVRQNVKRALNLAERNFELSQNFIYFYGQLEKSADFLADMADMAELPLNSPKVQGRLRRPIMDNGQWFTFAKLADKYGVVPKFVMPDTQCSPDTKYVTRILSDKLRLGAKLLREGAPEQREAIQRQELAEIYGILCRFLGQPPETFDFSFRTADGQYRRLTDLTPLEFFRRYGGVDVCQYMTIIHHPLPERPYGKVYTANPDGADDITKRLNLDMETIKKLVIAQLQGGDQVVMGCDVAKQSHKPTGYMHKNLLDYETAFGARLTMPKADRIRYKGTSGTHIMTFSGVELDETGAPVRWKVHNSYGPQMGIQGHYVMDDSWFDEYVLSVVIHKKYAPPEIAAAYEAAPQVMDPGELY